MGRPAGLTRAGRSHLVVTRARYRTDIRGYETAGTGRLLGRKGYDGSYADTDGDGQLRVGYFAHGHVVD